MTKIRYILHFFFHLEFIRNFKINLRFFKINLKRKIIVSFLYLFLKN
jgi:hypothetical protein